MMETIKEQRRAVWLVAAALVVVTAALYWQVGGHELTNVDDRLYVSENEQVLSGLTTESIAWAFTDRSTGNWHPLTWLSLMLDCQLFENTSAATHLTNLLLHLANTLLLFHVLRLMTGATWPSAFVAALFALHPLHVESVAWVSERKDVLSTLFWLLTMWAYVRYTERRSVGRYVPIVIFFVLGLMSKSMLVTLPFALLLLDFWPLRRIGFEAPIALKRLVLEKLPLILITAAVAAVAFVTQRGVGAVLTAGSFPPGARVAHALVVYLKYLGKMFWPEALQVHYRHYGLPAAWQVALAGLCVAGVLVAAWVLRRRYPYLLSGWLWYLGTLIPVIGLVQIGAQAMADRYTYVPSIGVFIIVAWGVGDLSAGWKARRVVLALGALAVLVPLSVATYRQVGYWKDSFTLHGHSVSVAPENYHGYMGLAVELDTAGRYDEAIEQYAEVLRIVPSNRRARYRMGLDYERSAMPDRAIELYRAGLELTPDDKNLNGGLARALNNLGAKTLRTGGDQEVAQDYFEQALEASPEYNNARMNLANLHIRAGDFEKAADLAYEALELDPEHAGAKAVLRTAVPFFEKQREYEEKEEREKEQQGG